jgi:hypothetical protein
MMAPSRPAVRAQLDAAYTRLQAAPGDADTWGNFALLLHSYGDARSRRALLRTRGGARADDAHWFHLHGTAPEDGAIPGPRGRRAASHLLDPRAIRRACAR